MQYPTWIHNCEKLVVIGLEIDCIIGHHLGANCDQQTIVSWLYRTIISTPQILSKIYWKFHECAFFFPKLLSFQVSIVRGWGIILHWKLFYFWDFFPTKYEHISYQVQLAEAHWNLVSAWHVLVMAKLSYICIHGIYINNRRLNWQPPGGTTQLHLLRIQNMVQAVFGPWCVQTWFPAPIC